MSNGWTATEREHEHGETITRDHDELTAEEQELRDTVGDTEPEWTTPITMESIGLDPTVPMGRLSAQKGGRAAQPVKPVEGKDGRWSARFYHPRTGKQTIKVIGTYEHADAVAKAMFDLWIANGKPQPDYPYKAKGKSSAAVAHTPKRAEPAPASDGAEFDPQIGNLWGKVLTVVMVGLDENDEPMLALRTGERDTFLVKVQGHTAV